MGFKMADIGQHADGITKSCKIKGIERVSCFRGKLLVKQSVGVAVSCNQHPHDAA